jgi:hypothetical protein
MIDHPPPDTAPGDSTAAPPALQRFEGYESFREQVRATLARAAEQGWREVILCGADFLDWPLGERTVVESLTAWAQTGTRLTLLARHFNEVARQHPRWVNWRRTWGHKVECRACAKADAFDLSSAIWTPAWFVLRNDLVRHAGLAGADPGWRTVLEQQLQDWLGRSASAFPVTTLGL